MHQDFIDNLSDELLAKIHRPISLIDLPANYAFFPLDMFKEIAEEAEPDEANGFRADAQQIVVQAIARNQSKAQYIIQAGQLRDMCLADGPNRAYRLVLLYAAFMYAMGYSTLTQSTLPDFWSMVDEGNFSKSRFVAFYDAHLARLSMTGTTVTPGSMRKNLARFFNMEDERCEVELARTFEAVRKTHQEFMDALAGAILDADFAGIFHAIQNRYKPLNDDEQYRQWRKLAGQHKR
ncbi:hypothetical protein [Paraburkholderia aromaticivorans]|uniref:hypothetical protein n=1 Tax=Paraburkholderia aromaticivorans TaxID=2026199 RepID=UPI0038BDD2BC